MKIYLVGGAVRDKLLGIPQKEKDWVVVGATQHDMLQKGFRQVGKDFPVFLHPKTHEEYALARKERKISKGYTGFEFDTSPSVTLEEDLSRRDITINAMAEAEDGTIIDPFHGQLDLEKGILRHVSPAFTEDPVRILRVSRFAARFNFTIAPETVQLMKIMVENGEISALVPERVWKELERALVEKYPDQFFTCLAQCDALPILFPCIDIHSPGVTFLKQAPHKVQQRFATLVHNLDAKIIMNLCKQYKIPHEVRDLSLLVSQFLPIYQKAQELAPCELINLFQKLDAYRREQRFKDFLDVCEACSNIPSQWLQNAFDVTKNIDIQEIIKNYQGKVIAEKIQELRSEALKKWLSSFN